jgi:hypothetical protein
MATGIRVSATPIGHGSPVDGMEYKLAKWTAVHTKAIRPTRADGVSDVRVAVGSRRAEQEEPCPSEPVPVGDLTTQQGPAAVHADDQRKVPTARPHRGRDGGVQRVGGGPPR